jgi:uncharacterized protein (TIGR04255 family)
MPFPRAQRVRYKKNTLQQVISQLRFPTILRIDTEKPSEFQDRIRNRFPIYAEIRPLSGIDLPEPLARIVREQMQFLSAPVTYQFQSPDSRWSLGLGNEFLALTDRGYTRWEEFREHLELPLLALEEIYRPAFYSRIGLRYQNLIRRSQLEMPGTKWSDLLQPYICGELSQADIASSVEQAARQLVVDLGDGSGKVQVQHGLAPGNAAEAAAEVCFGIDADFYTSQPTEVSNGRHVLDGFNRRARDLFRWCITDQLHRAMEPEPL